ncbi:hypothetical protein Tco_1111563 [Tanacetum coccineum]|uniref:Uncharacterized protein n=1 Tax=Tanacetum coccineum TaxID=301880 RepID=A0ABQ5INF5_9ASTR
MTYPYHWFSEQVGLAGDLGSTNDVLIPLFSVHCSCRTIDTAYSPVEYGASTFHSQYNVFNSNSQYGVFSQLNTAYRLSDTATDRFNRRSVTETMTEPTMEEYVNKTRGDYYSGITKTMINGKDAYELKGKFLDDLRNNAFSRTNGEDAVEHIKNFLKNVDPLDLPNVSYERLRLVVFPISLPGDARKNDEETIREERKPNDDHGIGNFDNDLVQDSAPYLITIEGSNTEEDMCELLGIPPSTMGCKIGKF